MLIGKVVIDECGQCGGIWLDAGELADLRDLYKTEEERKNAASGIFDAKFSGQLESFRANSEQKAMRFANAFRFICPTYYIPGKQKWGAF